MTEEAVKELEAKERRCSILPRLITAAKVKRLELERAREERLAKPFEEEQTAAYERIQEATAAKLKADEDLGVARAAWGDAHMRFENRRRRIKEIDREIAALKGEA